MRFFAGGSSRNAASAPTLGPFEAPARRHGRTKLEGGGIEGKKGIDLNRPGAQLCFLFSGAGRQNHFVGGSYSGFYANDKVWRAA